MSEKKIYVFAKMRAKNGEVERVIDLLKKVAQKSWEEEGNLCYKINRCSTDQNIIVVFEGYRDEAAQKLHQASAHFQQLVIGKIIPLIEHREMILTTPL